MRDGARDVRAENGEWSFPPTPRHSPRGCDSRSLQSLNYCEREKKGTACSLFAGWLNYPHCAEIQCHTHRAVAWPKGIGNCLPSNMSHVLARIHDVLIEFTVNTNLPFRTAKSFKLLEIWTNPTIMKSLFAVSGNNTRLLPSKCHKLTIETSRPHVRKFSSLLVAYTRWQTTHSSRQSTLTEICTGKCQRSSPTLLITAVVRGCDHFQMSCFCGCANQIVLSNSRLPPWTYKRLQTTLRPSESTAHQYVVRLRKEHRSMLDVNKPNWTFCQAILSWIDVQYTSEKPKIRTQLDPRSLVSDTVENPAFWPTGEPRKRSLRVFASDWLSKQSRI